ncbi:GNAT family N-acetyltransferase [uncultured Phycicoccus sp.]|uniref:GNAT family N-acetyltransferase n=1 Tax=uncultured Phycicoccus sp. TaxID=661422 RepID=UPI00263383EF|nr:GNAT family N-acetyltransferase [uncultured Phycicoccus sp.]
MASRTPRYERLTTFARDLTDLPDPGPDRGYRLERADEALLAEFHRTAPKGLNARKLAVLRDRLGTDEQVWVVRDADGAFLGWCHMIAGSGPNSRIGHTLRLRADEVFLFDDRTLAGFQRRGVHAFTIRRRMELAREAGARRAVTTITNANAASRASYGRLGFTPRSQLLHVPALHRTVELPATPAWLREVARGRRGRR